MYLRLSNCTVERKHLVALAIWVWCNMNVKTMLCSIAMIHQSFSFWTQPGDQHKSGSESEETKSWDLCFAPSEISFVWEEVETKKICNDTWRRVHCWRRNCHCQQTIAWSNRPTTSILQITQKLMFTYNVHIPIYTQVASLKDCTGCLLCCQRFSHEKCLVKKWNIATRFTFVFRTFSWAYSQMCFCLILSLC